MAVDPTGGPDDEETAARSAVAVDDPAPKSHRQPRIQLLMRWWNARRRDSLLAAVRGGAAGRIKGRTPRVAWPCAHRAGRRQLPAWREFARRSRLDGEFPASCRQL